MSDERRHHSPPGRSIASPPSDGAGRGTSSDDDYDAQRSTLGRNLFSPSDATSLTSTLPRLPSAMSQATDGSTRTLRVARVVPTLRPATSSPLRDDAASGEDYSSSGDKSGSESDSQEEEPGDSTNETGSSPFQRGVAAHRSIRLNAQERAQRHPVVIPHRYASIRLHAQSELYYACTQ